MLHQRWQVCKGIPSIKHVCYEVVNKGDLGLGDATGIPVKHWHHYGQPLSLLFIRLRKVLLRDPASPFNAQVQGAAGVGYVRTLDHHAFDQGLVLREVLPGRAALAVAAVNLSCHWLVDAVHKFVHMFKVFCHLCC